MTGRTGKSATAKVYFDNYGRLTGIELGRVMCEQIKATLERGSGDLSIDVTKLVFPPSIPGILTGCYCPPKGPDVKCGTLKVEPAIKERSILLKPKRGAKVQRTRQR